ncbi:MAG TPA: hypothetical protein DCZ95_11060 [Verrucomicrobia bacterium]|nr:MAG: hypothetical protein A2X46_07925 [Lentisphaerae bacterium GWF2_57_35]HBA84624.1 hypothetical protein [Verrucomicrobiota bacterium]
MFSLAQIASAVGCFILLVNLPAIFAPGKFLQTAKAFPRSKIPAWTLTALDLFWVAWIVLHASLGRFEFVKPALYVAAPLAFLLIAVFMDELLAPRALGGLLLLAANPVLAAARWHPSTWRLAMTVMAYAWVVVGIALVLSPYRFRQAVEWVNPTVERCRAWGMVRCLVGAAVLFLGLVVY